MYRNKCKIASDLFPHRLISYKAGKLLEDGGQDLYKSIRNCGKLLAT